MHREGLVLDFLGRLSVLSFFLFFSFRFSSFCSCIEFFRALVFQSF